MAFWQSDEWSCVAEAIRCGLVWWPVQPQPNSHCFATLLQLQHLAAPHMGSSPMRSKIIFMAFAARAFSLLGRFGAVEPSPMCTSIVLTEVMVATASSNCSSVYRNGVVTAMELTVLYAVGVGWAGPNYGQLSVRTARFGSLQLQPQGPDFCS
jgi:hypothetical protein